MSQKIGLEVANGYIKVVSDDVRVQLIPKVKTVKIVITKR